MPFRVPLRRSVVGAMVVTAATLAAIPGVPTTARAAEDGRALLAKGDYEGAAKAFLDAVHKDPADVEARRGAAEALLGLGRAEEAAKQAEAGLDIEGQGSDAGLWLLLARSYLARGDASPSWHPDTAILYADAAAKAAVALRHDPALNAARTVQARALRLRAGEGDFEEAAKVLGAALEKDPRDFDALFESGELALKSQRPKDAVALFGSAAEVDPKSATARLRLGLSRAYLKEWEAAVDEFRRAAILDPRDSTALGYIGKYAGKGAPDVYRAVVKEAPTNAWAHAYLAWALAAISKDEAGATKACKDASALAPKDGRLQAWLGMVQNTMGKAEEARKTWKKALQLDAGPGADIAWNGLLDYATNPASAVSMEEREAWIEFLGRTRPEDPWVWNNAGLIYRDVAKDYRKALQAYLKAAELKPDDQGIVNDTGLIYQYHGKSIGEDPMKALPYYEAVLLMVEQDGQAPVMGYRDTLENLAVFHGPPGDAAAHKPDPELALRYGTARNDKDFLARLSKDLAYPSPKAAGAAAWARKELKKAE